MSRAIASRGPYFEGCAPSGVYQQRLKKVQSILDEQLLEEELDEQDKMPENVFKRLCDAAVGLERD